MEYGKEFNLNVYYVVCRIFSRMKIYRGRKNRVESSNSKPFVRDVTNSHPVTEVTESKSRGAATGKKQRKAYQSHHVTAALRDVSLGTSIKKAAAKWKVPRSSLQYFLKTGNDPECRPGPAAILTKMEEELLADWLIEMSRRGIPINKQNLLDSVSSYFGCLHGPLQPMSAHASQAFSIASCTDSEDLPIVLLNSRM